jgi:hypothetical protein
MKIKSLVAAAVLAVSCVGTAQAASFTFAGSWRVDQGRNWQANPAVYSGQEAAAFLFGGIASDYAISTFADLSNITHTAWYSIWGVAGGTVFADDVHHDLGGSGYNSGGYTNSAYSAYVSDNALGAQYTNYAYRVSDIAPVPEPATYAMLLAGLGLMGGMARRRKQKQANV